MTIGEIVVWLIVGALAGTLAGRLMTFSKRGFGQRMGDWLEQQPQRHRTMARCSARIAGTEVLKTFTHEPKSKFNIQLSRIHEFDVSNHIEDNGFNFTASLKF